MGLQEINITTKEDDRSFAFEALNKLRATKKQSGNFVILDELKFTENMKAALAVMLEKMASGDSVSIISTNRDYTPREAAELLRFSRGHLTALLDKGEIPFRWVGSHRRIDAIDLMSYKEKLDRERKEAFDEMARLGQEIEHG